MKYDEIIDTIRSIVSGNTVDNDEMSAILREHGCYYLLSKLPSQKQTVQIELMFNRLVINRRYNACAGVFEQLSDIPYAVIKGAVLSKQIYGNTDYRFSGDIDILVPPKNAESAKAILTDNSFVQGRVVGDKIVPYTRRELIYQKTFSHQLAAFVKATDDKLCPFVNIDVNTDIMWGESEAKTDMDRFLSNTIPYEIDGIAVKKLLPEEEFISLCLHHYKDMNSIYLLSQGSLKLSLFCDIYFYVKNVTLDYSRLPHLAEKFKVSDYLYYCLYHTNKIFNDSMMCQLCSPFESDHAIELINRYGLSYDEYHYRQHNIAELLFDSKFPENFVHTLTESEKAKIKTNKAMM